MTHKHETIRAYQRASGYSILVETGTYQGDTIEAVKDVFEQIYSIELGADLHRAAQKRFARDSNVCLIHGDSGRVMQDLVNNIFEPAIFWLDGHYSGGITAKGDSECPIYGELEAIMSADDLDHIILIDDARCFTGHGDWPSLIELAGYLMDYDLHVKDDIIRCKRKRP